LETREQFYNLSIAHGAFEGKKFIMADICRSCRKAPVEVIEVLDDPKEPYKICKNCYHRLQSYSLRPLEWYNLRSIHGCLNDLLGEDYYDEKDGRALKPAEEVVDAASLTCPTFEEAAASPETLLSYILTRCHIHDEEIFLSWYIHEDLVSAMRKHAPDALLSVYSRRLKQIKNVDIICTIFHLIGLTLERKGATLVRDNWEDITSTDAFSGIAFAASKCLPIEEGHAKVSEILSGMDIRTRDIEKHVLCWFETALNLDWIEENAHPPVDISWGSLAASSKIDWARIKKWLLSGRPLSLVALDTLHLCASSVRKPPLLNPPNMSEFTKVLKDYLNKDNVPRVKSQVSDLFEFRQKLTRPMKKTY
jgi:hypothetical protein